MNLEVLISTMNLEDNNQLINEMNINTKSVTINQTSKIEFQDIENSKNRAYSYIDKGLSKSRNLAIKHAKEDICVIADDDLIYDDNYEKTILEAYNNNPNADIICFWVPSLNNNRPTTKQKSKKIGYLTSMKISSYQITFRRESIIKADIKFDEMFGTGSEKYLMGEENIFLYDCLRKKLKIVYIDKEIAKVKQGNSTWFNGYNETYFKTKGACYYRMSNFFSTILIYQFAIRKQKLFKKQYSILKAIKLMKTGKKEYKQQKNRS